MLIVGYLQHQLAGFQPSSTTITGTCTRFFPDIFMDKLTEALVSTVKLIVNLLAAWHGKLECLQYTVISSANLCVHYAVLILSWVNVTNPSRLQLPDLRQQGHLVSQWFRQLALQGTSSFSYNYSKVQVQITCFTFYRLDPYSFFYVNNFCLFRFFCYSI